MGKRTVTRHLLMIGAALTLAACQEGTSPFGFLKSAPKGDAEASAQDTATTEAPRTVERDVESPEVFSTKEDGLWDGRPSLGGVWVAHPAVKDPERVMIVNESNGKSVIGALFRRERDNPGPKLQVSSDAAAALEMLAGAPTKLSVVALRRKAVPVEPVAPLVTGPVIATPEKIDAKPIEPAKTTSKTAPAKAATKAPPAKPDTTTAPAKTAPAKTEPVATAPSKAPAAKPAAPTPPETKAPDSKVATKPVADIAATAGAAIAAAESKPAAPAGKMFVQIGIFSTEENAKRATEQLAKAGIVAAARSEESQGKTFWRVVAGPASGVADRDTLIKKIRDMGYSDAYAVSK